MGDWVRYKLDQQTDHILVDEAQDTNTSQWNIVRALAWEYFAGEGAARGPRTIFTVGDYKQAIFGFQGTDPQSFDVARAWFARQELATKIAKQIKAWVDKPFWLECRKRPLRPEDILILLRSRGELASLIVARLHALDVPVAGVDRLSLSAPLAVQDLLAAARFAIQPLDDLNLASLLVSPLLGWSQDELYAAAFRRSGSLWPHLRAAQPPE